MNTKIPILELYELDDFNKAHHKKAEVSKFIYNVSWKNQEHYTIQDYSARTPKKIIEKNPNSPFRGLKIVEFNPTELCNRTCHFCPRHDPEVYPNLNLHLEPSTVQNVVDDLVKHGYRGQMMFSGFGEPLLNRKILECIKICADAGYYVELTTNGDKILQGKWYELQEFVDAGLSAIHIDIYDDTKQYLSWTRMLNKFKGKINYRITPRYVTTTAVFSSRAGSATHEGISQGTSSRPCFVPSVKAFINWNGDLDLCCHDWQREGGGFGNVNDKPFSEVWNSDSMNSIRSKLMTSARNIHGAPCDKCTTGGNSKDRNAVQSAWVQHYKNEKPEFFKGNISKR